VSGLAQLEAFGSLTVFCGLAWIVVEVLVRIDRWRRR
jgi:hypothetical protein